MSLLILKILLLPSSLIPAKWEVDNDAKGEVKPHPNYDWERRTVLCFLVGAAMTAILYFVGDDKTGLTAVLRLARYTLATGLVFSAVFPVWMNYVHLQNGITRYKIRGYGGSSVVIPFWQMTGRMIFDHVVNHLSDSAWPDKVKIWRRIGWIGRMICYLGMLISAIYFWIM